MFKRPSFYLICLMFVGLFFWNKHNCSLEKAARQGLIVKRDNVSQKEDELEFYLEKPTKLVYKAPFKISSKGEAPVLEKGKSGEWDSVDLLNPSVIHRNDKYYNYYSGYDGKVWRTGLATSEDGLKWVKYENNPIIDVGKDEWDSKYIAANGSAIEFNKRVFYFYQVVSNDNRTSIGLSISEDGINFTKQSNPIMVDGLAHTWDSNGVADPYVISHDGFLYLYYLGMDDVNKQRIGVAKSKDGFTWKRYQGNPILDVGASGSFDENGLGEPSVIYNAPYFYMLYTGRTFDEKRDIGISLSLDGVNWSKSNVSGLFHDRKSGTWDDSVICDTTLLFDKASGLVNVWYGGGNKKEPAQNLNGNVGMFTIDLSQQRNMSGFEPNELSKNRQIDSTTILKGSYSIDGEEGKKQVWVSKDSNIILFLKGDSDINIKGFVPFSVHKQADKNIKDVKLTFLVNDKEVLSQTYTEDMPLDIKIDFAKIREIIENDDSFKLTIRSSHDFNLAKSNIGDDGRDLAFLLTYIGVN